MNAVQLRTVLHHLRQTVRPAEAGGRTDAELLQCWLSDADEAAFELLVWRHGPMVLRVCRRLLRQPQDVEDAFQATFLALVQKAAAIRNREAVGSWLYRVAYRVAVQARAAASRRRTHDPAALATLVEDDPWDPVAAELRAVLDEEVCRLPRHYRTPVVLCYFEGRTNAEAARELGCPVGTVVSRLARARQRLRDQLARRGFALPVGGVALSRAAAPAALAAPLVGAVVQAATASLGGSAAAVAPEVAKLAKGALRIMAFKQAKIGIVVLVAAMMVGGGLGVGLQRGPASTQAPAARPRAASPAPAARKTPPPLRLKMELGKPFYQVVTTKTDQVMNVNGMKINQKQEQTFYCRWTLKERTPNGHLIVEQKIEGVKLDIQLGANPITFDSTKPGAAAKTPLADFFKALVGSKFTVDLDPGNRLDPIVSINGADELINKLKNGALPLGPALAMLLDQRALKHVAGLAFSALPDKAVKPGDQWMRSSRLDMGSLGIYKLTDTYTYEGKKGKLLRIRLTPSLKFVPPAKGKALPGLPQITAADLKTTNARGTLFFNPDKGRVERSDTHIEFNGPMTFTFNGMPTTVELTQTQRTEVRTTDENPIKAKK